jgi:hypothetical protein
MTDEYEECRARRKRTGLGLDQCRKRLRNERLLADIEKAASIEDVKAILRAIVEET